MTPARKPARFRPVTPFNPPSGLFAVRFAALDAHAMAAAAAATRLEPAQIEEFQSSVFYAAIEGGPPGLRAVRIALALMAEPSAGAPATLEATVTYYADGPQSFAMYQFRQLVRGRAFRLLHHPPDPRPLRVTVKAMRAAAYTERDVP